MPWNWNIDTFAKSKQSGRDYVLAQPSIPPAVATALCALIDALPENREDLTIKIHTSGHMGKWEEFGQPQQIAKPNGFFNLWVGYSNNPSIV